MDLSEINWDLNEAGAWPLPVKAAVIFIVCALVVGGGVYYDTLDQLAALDVAEKKSWNENTFETKQRKAINPRITRDQHNKLKCSCMSCPANAHRRRGGEFAG
jgi:type IV pilus assembly protein PilO